MTAIHLRIYRLAAILGTVFLLGVPPGLAEEFLSRDRLVEDLIPITGNEPRAVDLKVPFELGSSVLAAKAQHQLDELASALKAEALKGLRVDIVGHTDALGSQAYNQALSEKRAAAVVDYLLSKTGLERDLFTAKGMGETQLLPDYDPVDPAHRRVEVVVHPPKNAGSDSGEDDDGFSAIN